MLNIEETISSHKLLAETPVTIETNELVRATVQAALKNEIARVASYLHPTWQDAITAESTDAEILDECGDKTQRRGNEKFLHATTYRNLQFALKSISD